MLKIVRHPVFTAPVLLNTLVLKGEFDVSFVALPTSELKALEKDGLEQGLTLQHATLRGVVKGWTALEIDGQPFPFVSIEDSLPKLLDQPGVGPAMLKAYYRALWEEASGN